MIRLIKGIALGLGIAILILGSFLGAISGSSNGGETSSGSSSGQTTSGSSSGQTTSGSGSGVTPTQQTYKITEIDRAKELRIENVSVGSTGIDIKGAGTGTPLFIEEVVIEGLVAPELYIGTTTDNSVKIQKLIISNTIADGWDLYKEGGTVGKVKIGAYGKVEGYILTNSEQAKIEISDTTGEGYIQTLVIKNVNSRGKVSLDYMVIGTLRIENAIIGADSDLTSKDLKIGDSNKDVIVETEKVSILERLVKVV